jgi:hypothetical protein
MRLIMPLHPFDPKHTTGAPQQQSRWAGRRPRYGLGDAATGGLPFDGISDLQASVLNEIDPGPDLGRGGGCTSYWVSCHPGPHEVGTSIACGSGLKASYEQLLLQICTCFAHSIGERSPMRDDCAPGMQ